MKISKTTAASPKGNNSRFPDLCSGSREPGLAAASAAVAGMIKSGDDALSLYEALLHTTGGFDEAAEAVAELGTMLAAWETHLPPGHLASDARFWSNVADLSGNEVGQTFYDLPMFDCGIALVLLHAIAEAAEAHLDEANSPTDD